ncbi:hypothetical protein J7I98_11890 [Streptomyces sp. ISL-98]|uniref:hypothetical protein n=1 Tax=Streptomyces sp. ISL-98 TaxID=2819192 RepID=UPI001BEA572C|nr:hypothetical protein [Streptomyces sp. ISL-98]MBT2506584.1 hypothetical protein [Streptomyces sp. ISL-98]
MRKFQQAMIAAVAAGGLTAIGAAAGTAHAHGGGGPQVNDLYRPYQECSPQTVAASDLPIAALGLAETFDTTCGQYNKAFTHSD